MSDIPNWIIAASSFGSLVVAIIALFKANGATNKVNSIVAEDVNKSKVGSPQIKGNYNKTATGSGNLIS